MSYFDLVASSSNGGRAFPARMPESQNLYSSGRLDDAVVEIVVNAGEM